MATGKTEVFVSYAWGGESEQLVNEIERSLGRRGIHILRDKERVRYGGSIRKFMETIGAGHAIIVVLSDEYLKSENCMSELLEIEKRGDLRGRVFPVVLPDAGIYDAIQRVEYVDFWGERKEALQEKIRALRDLDNTEGIQRDLDLYAKIRTSISLLADVMKDMNALTTAVHQASDFAQLAEAISGRLELVEPVESGSSEATPRPPVQAGPVPSEKVRSRPGYASTRRLFADYQEERELIRALATERCDRRILFFQGASGVGKTSLLGSCLEELEGHENGILSCPIDLRNCSISEILAYLCQRVGWERLPQFKAHLVTRTEGAVASPQQQIHLALRSTGREDRDQHLAAMTNEVFADLENLQQPLVVSLDHYEKASEEVSGWIEGPVLGQVASIASVRVVLAGQRVPERNIMWGRCCREQQLYGVKAAEEWLPVVYAMGKVLPTAEPQGWLAGVCHALDGHPSRIIKVIEGLKNREDLN